MSETSQRWRAGTKVHRTLYVHEGDDSTGRLVGLMDTPELAALVVEAVNAHLAARSTPEHSETACCDLHNPVVCESNDPDVVGAVTPDQARRLPGGPQVDNRANRTMRPGVGGQTAHVPPNATSEHTMYGPPGGPPQLVPVKRNSPLTIIGIGCGSLIAIVVLAALTVGCAPNPSATPTPAPSTASEDTSRRACHELSAANPNDDIDTRFDPLTWRATAQAAKTANDPGISAAGAKLHGVVAANEQLPETARVGEPNLALESALLSLANVCSNLYGDGPW